MHALKVWYLYFSKPLKQSGRKEKKKDNDKSL